MAPLRAGEVTPDDVKETLQRLVLHSLTKHNFHESEAGPLGLGDLPTYDMPDSGVAKCIVEIITDVAGPIPSGQIKEAALGTPTCPAPMV